MDVMDEELKSKLLNRQIVLPAEEWAVRYAAYRAIEQVVALSGKRAGAVDWFFFNARNAVLDPQYDKRTVSSSGVYRPMVVIDGQIVGIWKPMLKEGSIIVTPCPLNSLTTAENQALLLAAKQYGTFVGLPVALAK